MTRLPLSKRNLFLLAVTALLLLAVLVAIWLLTVQTPSDTMSLSGWWADLLVGWGVCDAERASFIVRKVVHTAEFLPVGVLAAVCAFLVAGKRLSGRAAVIGSMVFCVACSLGDQVHKLFVPGREFDGRDLVFDAIGYLAGIAIVWAIHAALERRAKHRE